MTTQGDSVHPAAVYQRSLILCDAGELIEKATPISLLRGQVLGALIVLEDEGLIHRELVLVHDLLKRVDEPGLFLGSRALGVDDLDRVADLLEDRFQQLIEEAVAEVGLNHQGVYLVILGNVSECGEHSLIGLQVWPRP